MKQVPLLGIDYGLSRIGIALSYHGTLAQMHRTLQHESIKSIISAIDAICRKEDVQKIIIGLPKSLDGTKGTLENTIKKFAKQLSRFLSARHNHTIPIIFQNEQFSSKLASRFLHHSQKIDEKSAELILQHYIDSRINNEKTHDKK